MLLVVGLTAGCGASGGTGTGADQTTAAAAGTAGNGNAEATTSAVASTAAAEAATNAKNDREMVVGVIKVNGTFDPYSSAYGSDDFASKQVYDSLVMRDDKGKIAPYLAESWEMSDGGKVITFKLRQGVKFTNGAEFTAEDAQFNIEKARETPTTEWAMSGVEACEVVDAYTLKVTLKAVDMSFFEKLAWMNFVNKAYYLEKGDQYGLTVENIVGTGPYIVSEWKPGEMALLTANEGYFLGSPSIKKARYKTISDANAAVIALQTGEINMYNVDVPSVSIDALSASSEVTVTSFPSYVFMDILLNCKDGLFADLKLRQAVAYGVDREKMLQVGTEGHGEIVDYPGGPDYIGNPNIKVFNAMDQEKAKQLVEEAGAAGAPITIKTQDTDPWPKLATALQDDLNKIGFDAKVELLDTNGYGQEIWTNLNYEIAISRYWSGTKEMAELMALLETDNPMNFSRYTNPAADPLIREAAGLSDEAARKGLYEQAVKLVMPDVPLVPLYYSYGSRAYTSDLTIDPGWVEYDKVFYYSWK
jgi:peptide/nickel transport system substrate-binding protein